MSPINDDVLTMYRFFYREATRGLPPLPEFPVLVAMDVPGQRPVPVKKAGPAAPFPVEPAASLNPNPKE